MCGALQAFVSLADDQAEWLVVVNWALLFGLVVACAIFCSKFWIRQRVPALCSTVLPLQVALNVLGIVAVEIILPPDGHEAQSLPTAIMWGVVIILPIMLDCTNTHRIEVIGTSVVFSVALIFSLWTSFVAHDAPFLSAPFLMTKLRFERSCYINILVLVLSCAHDIYLDTPNKGELIV
jgi:hypothetical protein